MRPLLTVPQLASQLGVSLPRAYELCRLGLIPGVVRLGRQIRLDSRLVDDWIGTGGQALPGGWRRHPVDGDRA
jgi:excisionase family DNA binding protein